MFTVSFLLFSSLGLNLNASDSLTKEALGEILFFDKNLSKNKTQSCATCHNPNAGFIDDREKKKKKKKKLCGEEGEEKDRQSPPPKNANSFF